MITDRLYDLSTSLDINVKDTESIIEHLLLYSLNWIDTGDLIYFLNDFDTDTKRKVIKFKKEFLDKTYYTLSRWWRAALVCYRKKPLCKYCHWKLTCSPIDGYCKFFKKSNLMIAEDFGVSERDLLLLDKLPKKYKKLLYKEANEKLDYIEYPDTLYYNKMISILLPYIRKLVYRKLTFIYTYNNFSAEDLINDLLCVALCIIISNDYNSEFNYTINYAKKSIRERSKNIIEHYTTQKRARVIETDSGYAVTTLSFDRDNSDNSGEDLTLHSMLSNEDTVSVMESKNLIMKLIDICTEKEIKVIKCILGLESEDFIYWLQKKGEEKHTSKIGINAADYYKLGKEGLQNIGKKLLKILPLDFKRKQELKDKLIIKLK